MGDLVLKVAGHSKKGLESKFVLKWEETYVILEAFDSGYYLISCPDSENLLAQINAKWIKLYYS